MMDSVADSAFGTVMVPKVLVIENRRLGFMHRILQVACIAWVAYNTFSARAWLVHTVPMMHGLEIWTTAGDVEGVDTASVPHCADPDSFDYTYSQSYAFDFDRCFELPPGETVEKFGSVVYVPTCLDDKYIGKAKGNADCANLQASCSGSGGNFTAAAAANANCKCEKSQQSFVKLPERTLLHFNHGYQVSWPDEARQKGRDKFLGVVKEGKAWQELENADGDATLLTVIRGPDGSPCSVGADIVGGGGKSEWTKDDVQSDGIVGSFEEWLACAGESLDAPAPTLASGRSDEVGVPRGRVAGMMLNLDLVYYNDAEKSTKNAGVVCEVSVTAEPLWNSAYKMAYSQVPDPPDGPGKYRFRKQYGISLNVQTKGRFAKFDNWALINCIVSALVLLSLPGTITQFVALYGVGLISKIYLRAQAQKLNIAHEFSGLAARVSAGLAAFQTLTGSDDDKEAAINGQRCREIMRKTFNKALQSGVLGEGEFNRLCDAVLRDLDTNGTEKINLDEFLTAFSSQEFVEPKDMVSFFDTDRRRGIMEIVFTDGALRSKVSSVHPQVEENED